MVRAEPNESRVRIKRLAPRWTIPEGIQTNREASSEVGVRIWEILIGRSEHARGDHLLELPLLVLLLQVHSDGGLLRLERIDFLQEARETTKGKTWSRREEVAGQVGW